MVGMRLVLNVVVGLVVDVFTRVSVFLDAPLGVHLGQLQIWSISIIESSMMSTRYFVNKRGFLVVEGGHVGLKHAFDDASDALIKHLQTVYRLYRVVRVQYAEVEDIA